MNESKRLYRLDKDQGATLAGVCGGIAEYFGLDPSLVRIAWVVLSICTTSIFFWIYLVAAFVLPKKSDIYPGY